MTSPTVREGVGLEVTVRETEPSATLREAGGAASAEPSGSLIRLPRDLASRFAIERELPTRGNEADLLVVAPIEGGERVVVKLYRANVRPKDEVQRRIAAFNPAHVVRQLDWGVSEGRSYEVIEYADEGSLADLMRAAPAGRLDAPKLRAMVEQVSGALRYAQASKVLSIDSSVSTVNEPKVSGTNLGNAGITLS